MLRPQPTPPVPEATARAARAAFPKGNRYITLRDELGTVFTDEMFAHLFPKIGQPAEAPWRLALVLIVQQIEGLSDRDMADAVRDRLALKYLLSLEIDDPGFHYSALSRFRSRLLEGNAEQLLLDTLIEKCKEVGLIKARGKSRTDATHILAAARAMERLENVAETLRAALNAVAKKEPDWLKAFAPGEWYKRYSQRAEWYQLLRRYKAKDKQALFEQIGSDGMVLLSAIYHGAAPVGLAELPAVNHLRQCWLQQFWLDDSVVKLRDADGMKPSAERLDTPYDSEARRGTKGGTFWMGYKAHFTETCDDHTPHLIVHVDTTKPSVADLVRVTPIHEALKQKDLLPADHFVDNNYVTSKLLVDSKKDYGVSLIGPIKAYRKAKGFSVDLFEIDWHNEVVTCPAGKQSIYWRAEVPKSSREQIAVSFAPTDCRACPLNEQCAKNTTRKGRTLTLLPKEQYEAREQVKREQNTREWRFHHQIRQGVEGTISQGVHAGLRRSWYHGLRKTHLRSVAIAAGMNIQRISDWYRQVPRAKTQMSSFAALRA